MRLESTVRSALAEFKWSVSLREAGLVLLVAVAVTTVSWFLRDDGLPLAADPMGYELELAAPLTSTEKALALYDEGEYHFVDTRPVTNGDFQTIPGAFFIREASFDDDLLEYFDFMTTEDHFILFGDGELFPVSNIAARMKDRDYRNLLILKGGLDAWLMAGGEISRRNGGES
ncbi:MAG: rhodanese-like domain-containing protein [Candidatus Krumholzibacteria bacterium]|nr:rhodanese-like domain-containing protein [Candidatus Krumholzibacteria bacterium]